MHAATLGSRPFPGVGVQQRSQGTEAAHTHATAVAGGINNDATNPAVEIPHACKRRFLCRVLGVGGHSASILSGHAKATSADTAPMTATAVVMLVAVCRYPSMILAVTSWS